MVIIKTVKIYSLVQCVKLFLVLSTLTFSSFPANDDFCRLCKQKMVQDQARQNVRSELDLICC